MVEFGSMTERGGMLRERGGYLEMGVGMLREKEVGIWENGYGNGYLEMMGLDAETPTRG